MAAGDPAEHAVDGSPPVNEAQAWMGFDTLINAALRPFHANVQFYPRCILTGSTPTPTLYQAWAVQLYNYTVGQAPIRQCARERCGNHFTVQRGRTRYGQHRTSGTKYCSSACTKAQNEQDPSVPASADPTHSTRLLTSFAGKAQPQRNKKPNAHSPGRCEALLVGVRRCGQSALETRYRRAGISVDRCMRRRTALAAGAVLAGGLWAGHRQLTGGLAPVVPGASPGDERL